MAARKGRLNIIGAFVEACSSCINLMYTVCVKIIKMHANVMLPNFACVTDWQVCGYDRIKDVLCSRHSVCSEETDASSVPLYTSRLVSKISF